MSEPHGKRFESSLKSIYAVTLVPVPFEYSRASEQFTSFLIDARDEAGLTTTHQAFTMVQGVLQTFRRRLSIGDALRFADVLPVGLRALFVAAWDTQEPKLLFNDRIAMTKEVQSLRPEHNFSPDTSISDVARALWRHVDATRFRDVLRHMPAGAVEFWEAPGPTG